MNQKSSTSSTERSCTQSGIFGISTFNNVMINIHVILNKNMIQVYLILLLTNSMETKFEASWKRWMFSKSNTLQHKI